MYQNRKDFEKILILLLDIVCLSISLGCAYVFRYRTLYGREEYGDQLWLVVFILLCYALVNGFEDFYFKFFRRSVLEEVFSVIKAEGIFSVVMLLLLFLIHRSGELSRIVFGTFLLVNTVLMCGGRLAFKYYMNNVYKSSRHSNRLLVVTSKGRAEPVIKDIRDHSEWYLCVTGIVLTDAVDGGSICDIPVVANQDSMMEYVKHNDVDEVLIMDDEITHTRLLESWIYELGQMGIQVNVNINIFNIDNVGKKTWNQIGNYTVVTFARNFFSFRQMAAKRAMDIIGSLVGLVLLGIATIFVAPAIKLESPGPVFFGQTRIGKNGRKFTFYKFRSMYQDAEQRKQELMTANEIQGPMFKIKEDPRITKVGRFIRKTSIDELPQFWNVLRGDMSLVGTRPPTEDEFERYEAKYKCRLSMTPGITGLWQVSGRSEISDFEEVLKLDMQYIDHWSFWLDVGILFKTVGTVLRGRGSS